MHLDSGRRDRNFERFRDLLVRHLIVGPHQYGRAIELHCGTGYTHTQVWVPSRTDYAALEPMTAPTNALVDGGTAMVAPGDRYVARFTLRLR